MNNCRNFPKLLFSKFLIYSLIALSRLKYFTVNPNIMIDIKIVGNSEIIISRFILGVEAIFTIMIVGI